MAQEIKIFRPTLIDEKPLPLGSEEFSYAPKLLQASSDGMIKVKLEEEVIIQRVSHDLYANPRSGFREFYNNECRACRTASRVFGANPSIEVTLIPSERKLVIQGVDSLGISQDKFLQVYSVLGRSDNFSGEEIGLFGLGRNSYTTLSDTMVLETFSREDETKYAVMGKNGIAYNLLPKPNLDSHGTRVTFVLDQKVPILDMLDYIVDCTAFSGIDTFLNLAEKIELPSYWRSDFPSEKGRYTLGPKRFDEHLEQKVRNANKWHEVVKYLPIRIEDEDFELYGAFVVRKDYNGLAATEESDEREVRLLGTPVEATDRPALLGLGPQHQGRAQISADGGPREADGAVRQGDTAEGGIEDPRGDSLPVRDIHEGIQHLDLQGSPEGLQVARAGEVPAS